MFNKNYIRKVVPCLVPAVVGLVLCFNGLKNAEEELENITRSQAIFTDSKMARKIEEPEVKVEEPKEVVNAVEEVKEPEIVDETIEPKELIVIAKSGLNVRKDANKDTDINTVYPFATRFTTDTIKGDWYKTDLGYVHKDFVMEFATAIDTGVVTELDLELYNRLNGTSDKELNVSVTGISNLTLKDIQSFTSKHPGLKGIEEAAIRAEYEYDVNAFATIAVAALESGYGSSDIAKDKNNLYGMNAQDHNPYNLAYSYNSKYTSAMHFAKLLDKGYISKGLTSLDTIQTKYTSDPNWDEKVNKIMSNVYNVVMNNRSKTQ